MLDARLFPLLETLAKADLDWLAQEVIAGALAGRVPEEPTERLLAARRIVFRKSQEAGALGPTEASDQFSEQFTGQEQVEWAANHVANRLDVLLDMLALSIDRVDQLVGVDRSMASEEQDPYGTMLVLIDSDTLMKVERGQISAAKDNLGNLREALDAWAAQPPTTGGPT